MLFRSVLVESISTRTPHVKPAQRTDQPFILRSVVRTLVLVIATLRSCPASRQTLSTPSSAHPLLSLQLHSQEPPRKDSLHMMSHRRVECGQPLVPHDRVALERLAVPAQEDVDDARRCAGLDLSGREFGVLVFGGRGFLEVERGGALRGVRLNGGGKRSGKRGGSGGHDGEVGGGRGGRCFSAR